MKTENVDKTKMLEKEFIVLQKKLAEFEAIKRKISFLIKKKPSDPQTIALLNEIRKITSGGIHVIDFKLKKDLNLINHVLSEIGVEIKWPS